MDAARTRINTFNSGVRTVRFSTSVRIMLSERTCVSFILILVRNVSPLHEAAEGADFPKLDPDSLGVAGGVA